MAFFITLSLSPASFQAFPIQTFALPRHLSFPPARHITHAPSLPLLIRCQPGAKGTSLYERLKKQIARIHQISATQVDIFSLRDVPGNLGVDVRYNCHSSPFYTAARLDGLLLRRRQQVGLGGGRRKRGSRHKGENKREGKGKNTAEGGGKGEDGGGVSEVVLACDHHLLGFVFAQRLCWGCGRGVVSTWLQLCGESLSGDGGGTGGGGRSGVEGGGGVATAVCVSGGSSWM